MERSLPSTEVPSIKSAHAMITDACRSKAKDSPYTNGAFEEAVGRIRKAYEEVTSAREENECADKTTYHLTLSVEDLRYKPNQDIALRTYIGGVRRKTDELTAEEARIVRIAARHLADYLTSEYDLTDHPICSHGEAIPDCDLPCACGHECFQHTWDTDAGAWPCGTEGCTCKNFTDDPLDILTRLDELRRLENGWFEGSGKAPSHDGLDWLEQVFGQHCPDDLPSPYLYPTAEGGVRAEWSLNSHEITLEIDLATHSVQWHAIGMDTGADESRTLNLNESKDWDWLIEQIRQMNKGKAR